MKKRNFSLNLFSVLLTLVCALVGIADSSAMGLYTAEAAVVTPASGEGAVVTREGLTTDVTRSASPDLIADTVDQRITKMRPSATPLDQIMRHATPKKAGSMRFEYYSTDIRPVKATVGAKHDKVTTQDYADLTVDNGKLFDETDTIYVPSITGFDDNGSATTKALVLYVLSVSGNVVRAMAVNGGAGTGSNEGSTYVPDIPSGTKIYRMARAASEGEVQTSPYSALPTKKSNYCQIFKCQVAMTSIQALSDTEVKWTPSEIEEQAVYEFRMAMEASYLFGVRKHFFNSLKKAYVYTTEGVVNSITKTVEYPAINMKNEDLVDIHREIFTGNSGSRRRIMLAGSGFVANWSKIKMVEKQLEAGNTVVAWGIEWKSVTTNFGETMLLQHDLLDMYGFEDKAIVIDPQYLDKWAFKSMTRDVLDLKKAGTYDGDVAVLTEISGPALRYPQCHAILTPSSSIKVTGIETDTTVKSLVAGATYNMAADLTIAPANATDQDVVFTTSNATKATVSSAGVVTAVAAGTAVITATTADGGYQCTLTVTVTAD
jgi:hypothetical protein